MVAMSAERKRLAAVGSLPWRRWGPYLSERQWGTVREDYSADGDAWGYFPHDHARSRAYRWGEDGLAGICDDGQRLCLALALWNGRDPILKERLFGLAGPEGNHGEDVKELYYYLDATPTASFLEMLYKYPQAPFPYAELVEENRRRGRRDPEYELLDTGVFDGGRYFDVTVTVAKAAPEDLLVRVTAVNRGPEAAPLHLLPQLWFRNTWAWGRHPGKPQLWVAGEAVIAAQHADLGMLYLHAEGAPELLFTENESNVARLWGVERHGHFKDAFHDYLIGGRADAVDPGRNGTKAAAHYACTVPAGGEVVVRLRLCRKLMEKPFLAFDRMLGQRRHEADEFYRELAAEGPPLDPDAAAVRRQAFAGMLWSQQFYHYDVREWLAGDPAQPPPPAERRLGRNHEWFHFNNADVVSMPDTWEYPWYAAWDLAFHAVPLAQLDPEFAKAQLVLLTREWYQHPNGQLPAYEWALGDVNPPVHAWGAWRVYRIDAERRAAEGKAPDFAFLERIFHKLLLNFTWWVNRKDVEGRNLFQGGFLGLDNIGVFDRSAPLPTGVRIDQADGTSWMAMYSLNLMRIALELARTDPVYQDVATKFFEHFLYIAAALNDLGGQGVGLWDEEDAFFYDVLHHPDGRAERLKVRSMVGLIPLFAVEVLEPDLLAQVPEFTARLEWFLTYRPDLARLVSRFHEPGRGDRRLLSLLRAYRMKRVLQRLLDESEFLSDHGVRALSRFHRDHPYEFDYGGQRLVVDYEPGESTSGLFGGNSNWRGPVWFPANTLIVEALRRFHIYYGPEFKVECPTGSGRLVDLGEAADELARRLVSLFLRDAAGRRPVFGDQPLLQDDPHFRDHLLFYECFHGDSGRGVGASHQTGWTGLVATLMGRS
jgi:Mannosylglycerate hydrolase MGH1-like glycoside hydrolase domain